MTGVLVVVELGAEWPFWVGNTAGKAGRRVLSQEEGESPEAFTARVAEHLGSLFSRRTGIGLGVLACNERCDPSAMAARKRLCQAILSAHASSELLLTASGRSGRVRHALSAQASDLSESWATDERRVGVRFGDEMPLVEGAASAPRANVA